MSGSTTASRNTAIGKDAALNNHSGSNNTLVGYSSNLGNNALVNAAAFGAQSYVSTNNSIVLGSINGINNAMATTNVGIGTTAPLTRFHIRNYGASGGNFLFNASLAIEDNQTSFVQLSNPNDAENGILSGNAASAIRSALVFPADSSVNLRSGGNNTRLAINKAGSVGIATTFPQTKLHLYEPGPVNVNFRVASVNQNYDPGIELVKTGAAGTDWKLRVDNFSNLTFSRATDDFATAPVDYYQMSPFAIRPVTDNAQTLGQVNNRWNAVYAVNGAINTSDARDKENVEDLGYGIKEVMKLRPVTFNWKQNPQWGRKIGFIAQEVKPILSEVVQVGELRSKNPTKDEAALNSTEETRLGLYYADIIPVTVKAIQEQQAVIERQSKEIESLKATNSKLEKDMQQIKDKLGIK